MYDLIKGLIAGVASGEIVGKVSQWGKGDDSKFGTHIDLEDGGIIATGSSNGRPYALYTDPSGEKGGVEDLVEVEELGAAALVLIDTTKADQAAATARLLAIRRAAMRATGTDLPF